MPQGKLRKEMALISISRTNCTIIWLSTERKIQELSPCPYCSFDESPHSITCIEYFYNTFAIVSTNLSSQMISSSVVDAGRPTGI